MYCPHCGGEIQEGTNFCTWCGNSVTAVINGVQPGQAPATGAPVAGQGQQGWRPQQAQQPWQTTQGTTGQYQQGYTPIGGNQVNSGAYGAPAKKKLDVLAIVALGFLAFSAVVNFASCLACIGDSSLSHMVGLYGISAAVATGFFIVVFNKARTGQEITMGLKVLILIFGSLWAGICLLFRKNK